MKINSTLNLICDTDGGNPLPNLTWWIGQGRSLVKESGLQRVNGLRVKKSFQLHNLQRKDHGRLIGCSASNTDLAPPIETSFRVDMILPPVGVKLLREWSYFLASKTYNVSCQVFGSRPPPYTKVWIGSKYLKSEELIVQNEISTTIVSFVPDKSDQGRFLTCRAENPHLPNAAVETQWKIEVHHIPETRLINEENPDQKSFLDVNTGQENLKLSCLVDANPKSHALHWRKNGVLIRSEEEHPNYALTGNELIIYQVNRDTSGNYSCEAENLLGIGKSNRFTLKVKYKPFCQRNGSVLWYVSIREEIHLPCRVEAYPDADVSFHWTFHSERTSESTSLPTTKSIDLGLKSTLTYRPLSSMDYGTLKCFSKNSFGKQTEPCVFKIKPKGLPRIKSCHLKNTGLDWIRIECSLPPFNDDVENDQRGTNFRIFVRNIHSQEAILNTTLFEGNSDFTIPSLSPGNYYNVSIIAVNPQGLSEPYYLQAQTLVLTTTTPISTSKPLFVSRPLGNTTHYFIPTRGRTRKAMNERDLFSKDPFKFLPIIGILSGIVLVLMMVAVIVVVIIRNRSLGSDPTLKTHIAFNRTLDLDIDQDPRKDKDSTYEKLNDVKFEGISSMTCGRSGGTMEKKKNRHDILGGGHSTSTLPKKQPSIYISPKHSTLKKSQTHKEVMFADEVQYKPENNNRMVVYPQYHRQEDNESKDTSPDDGYARPQNLKVSYKDMENDHFPFNEAIPAPTIINRLSEVMMIDDKEDDSLDEEDDSILKPIKLL
ncbi:contactin-6 isoform X1 [Lepeophtheirus salmonis]